MDWYVGTEWILERKGLRKKVLDIEFSVLEKPNITSKVVFRVEEIQNLNERPSKYLGFDCLGQEQTERIGSALTPVDCYVELFLQQLIVGERAHCFIKTQNNEEIAFILKLERILDSKGIHKLTVKEMYELALRYKENGVAMFKKYPKFAHDYFARGAKCLLSYKPFDGLSKESDSVAGEDLQALLIHIQTNLAACLINLQRYEDVLYQTQFVETAQEHPGEKSVYRRAIALLNLKEFEAAQHTIEKIPNYQLKKDFIKLHKQIEDDRKLSNDKYKDVVQRMFTKI